MHHCGVHFTLPMNIKIIPCTGSNTTQCKTLIYCKHCIPIIFCIIFWVVQLIETILLCIICHICLTPNGVHVVHIKWIPLWKFSAVRIMHEPKYQNYWLIMIALAPPFRQRFNYISECFTSPMKILMVYYKHPQTLRLMTSTMTVVLAIEYFLWVEFIERHRLLSVWNMLVIVVTAVGDVKNTVKV